MCTKLLVNLAMPVGLDPSRKEAFVINSGVLPLVKEPSTYAD